MGPWGRRGRRHRHIPHELRHTYGTDVHDLSENLRAAQVAMGHTSPAVTAQYTRVTDQQIRDAIARLPYLDEDEDDDAGEVA